MPRIKRWFRKSHDVNRDPEMWEYREHIGQRADAIWDEILSIADRNDGYLPGRFEGYESLLAGVCKSTKRRVRVAFEWLTSDLHPWVSVDPKGTARVTNWLKYNGTREPIEIPTGITKVSPPNLSEPNLPKNPKPASPDPVDNSTKQKAAWKKAVDSMWGQVASMGKRDPQRFNRKLGTWAGKMLQKGWEPNEIRQTLMEFVRSEDKHGQQIAEWYPYLNRILQAKKTKEAQGESAKHKEYDPQGIGSILKDMGMVKQPGK